MTVETKLKRVSTMVFLCAAMVTTLQAQVFTSLFSFSGTDGGFPTYVLLAQGLDGSLYGTSSFGGTHGYGTIFKVTTVGTLITLYDFCERRRSVQTSV